MSKVTRVVVLCPNGRRQTINLTPNSSILQILEEVCQKQNLNPDDFDICHYNKPMDLSLPIRFANVPNNAQLELQPAKTARKDCFVTVALQLESGDRIMKDFVPSTSVWDVMEQCLSTKAEVTVAKKGEPVCIYMRQKLIGDAIKNTTLRGLGVTKGSALIRLMYRNPDDLSDQAHVSSPLSKPVKDLAPSISNNKLFNADSKMECDQSSEKQNIDSNTSTFPKNVSISTVIPDKQASQILHLDQNAANMNKNMDNLQSLPVKTENVVVMDFSTDNNTIFSVVKDEPPLCENKKMEIDSAIMDQDPAEDEEIGAIHYIGGRHSVVYSLDDITETKKADLPDEFFELTIEDARYIMEEFKKSRSDLENKPLLTKELRNRQIQKKLGRFKQTVIRIYFPERLVLQAVFEAQETVQDVIDFIRNFLEDQSLNFYLYTSPPKEKKEPTKTLIESMLIPASVVYFGTDSYNNSNYLMKSLREKITDPRAASLAAYESRKEAMREIDELQNESDDVTAILPEVSVEENQVPGPSYEPCVRVQTTHKAPKWLKLSKK